MISLKFKEDEQPIDGSRRIATGTIECLAAQNFQGVRYKLVSATPPFKYHLHIKRPGNDWELVEHNFYTMDTQGHETVELRPQLFTEAEAEVKIGLEVRAVARRIKSEADKAAWISNKHTIYIDGKTYD